MFWTETIKPLFTIMPNNANTQTCLNIKHAFFECVKHNNAKNNKLKLKIKNNNSYVFGITPSDR